MCSPSQPTAFAPAQLANPETVRRQAALLEDKDMLRQLYDAVNEIIVILNPERQIVFCNRHLLDLLKLNDPSLVYGRRPGEILDCIHSCQTPDGCGTTEFCSSCGAVNAILSALGGHKALRECHLSRGQGDAIDLLVRATPLVLDGQQFTIAALTDISHEKRRRALERIFFHDILNTAWGVQVMVGLLDQVSGARLAEIHARVRGAALRMVEEVLAQRDLAAAESHELAVRPAEISAKELLQELLEAYREYPSEKPVQLVLSPDTADITFASDRLLLSRILANLLKNAIEASTNGTPVTAGCRNVEGQPEFWVHNGGSIPVDIQRQIFQRSFSTKGSGRGLGTYSVKLLCDRYLNGHAAFTTSPEQGTTFTVRFPARLEAPRSAH